MRQCKQHLKVASAFLEQFSSFAIAKKIFTFTNVTQYPMTTASWCYTSDRNFYSKCIMLLVALNACVFKPKQHNNFRLDENNKGLVLPTLLKLNGVYAHVFHTSERHEYIYLRFFKDGRIFQSWYLPGEPNLDSIVYYMNYKGKWGYYVNAYNDLQYELWENSFYKYTFSFGTLDSSSFTKIWYKPRAIGRDTDFCYPPMRFAFIPLESFADTL